MVSYNFIDREFKGVPGAADEHIAVHLHVTSGLLHHESEEGVEQKTWERNYRAAVEERRRDRMRAAQEEGKELSELDLEDDLQRNQFNFSERAAQTFSSVTKTRVVCTEPPASSEASGGMSQWRIYDAYLHEYERLVAIANAEKAASSSKTAGGAGAGAGAGAGGVMALGGDNTLSRAVSGAAAKFGVGLKTGGGEDPMHTPEMSHSLQLMERLVSQNAEDEIYADFRFWEDASDAFRDNVGTCLPLWKFEDARTRKKQVTSMAWNAGHGDLFAVGYGSYDMLRQGSGCVAAWRWTLAQSAA